MGSSVPSTRLNKKEKAKVVFVFAQMGMPKVLLKDRSGVRKGQFEGYLRRMEKALLKDTPPENVAKFMARVRKTWA